MENSTDEKQIILTAKEAAKYLNISLSSLNKWRAKNSTALKYLKIGRCCKYRLKDLNEFLESRMCDARK